MAVTAASASASRGGGAFTVQVVVETDNVEMILHRLAASMDGPSLYSFLRGAGSEFFADDIESRFNEEGDVKSGFWKELNPATVRIREGMGFPGEGPINHRTGDLEAFLTDHRDFTSGVGFAQMDVPGEPSTALLQDKLITAQRGSQKANPRGFKPTPPRPVLATSQMDLEKLLILLEKHIVAEVISGGQIL